MLRKQIIKATPANPVPPLGEIDIAAVATVQVTSEAPVHPIDFAFDPHRGPGSNRWIAGEPGEQTVELQLCLSCDGRRTYRELVRQEYNFSPPGTTFERDWAATGESVTHLQLVIKPDKGDKPCLATLTSLVLR